MFIANKIWSKVKVCLKTTKYRIYAYRKVASVKCKKSPETSVVRRPQGGALMPCEESIAQKEEDKTSGKDSANKKPWTCLLQPSQLPFLLYESIVIPILWGGLAPGSPWLRLQIAIIC